MKLGRSLTIAGVTLTSAVLMTGCGSASKQSAPPPAINSSTVAPSLTATPPPSAPSPSPQTVYVMPGQQAPVAPSVSTQTQYVPAPYPTYPGYGGYSTYTPQGNQGSGSDTDFISRLTSQRIVTPSEGQRTAGGHAVCNGLATGDSLTYRANLLKNEPYNYNNALAGYFVGAAVRVYCAQYSYMLTS